MHLIPTSQITYLMISDVGSLTTHAQEVLVLHQEVFEPSFAAMYLIPLSILHFIRIQSRVVKIKDVLGGICGFEQCNAKEIQVEADFWVE